MGLIAPITTTNRRGVGPPRLQVVDSNRGRVNQCKDAEFGMNPNPVLVINPFPAHRAKHLIQIKDDDPFVHSNSQVPTLDWH